MSGNALRNRSMLRASQGELECASRHVKRFENTGDNTVGFVEPDSMPRIRNQLEPAYGHARRGGPPLVDAREDVLLTPYERCRDAELGPPLVKQKRRADTFRRHDAIQIPSERAVIAEKIEPVAVKEFLAHASGGATNARCNFRHPSPGGGLGRLRPMAHPR